MKKMKNQAYVYACTWHYIFGVETSSIAKIPEKEKDLGLVNESLGSNNGYSFYYCNTLLEAVKSMTGTSIEDIDFVNVSEEEIKQVKKEVVHA